MQYRKQERRNLIITSPLVLLEPEDVKLHLPLIYMSENVMRRTRSLGFKCLL